MTTIRSSATGSGAGATSATLTVGTPSVGDLVLVWLATSNEIVTKPPGWNDTNQWFSAWQVRRKASDTLSLWYHTWNESDVGVTPEFTFLPAPTLGMGDKDLSSTNYCYVVAVVEANCVVEWAPAQTPEPPASTLQVSPQKHAEGVTSFVAAFQPVLGATLTAPGGTLVQHVSGGSGSLSVWTKTGTLGSAPTVSSSSSTGLAGGFLTVPDAVGRFYNPPIIQEGPMGYDDLTFRFTLARNYTVLDNAGAFEAVRYVDTDTLNAATAVFVNNSPVTSSQVTALLASGVGGDFRYLDR